MIRIYRDSTEPPELTQVRQRELQKLRAIKRPLTKDDIAGYRIVAPQVWKMQHEKCCYCELKVQRSYQDVEHFRPKMRAERGPAFSEVYGYWWLSFTWENLLFSCSLCNRRHKRDQFPLKSGSQVLRAEEVPPATEMPLILNPAEDHGVEHIVFLPWSQRVPLRREAGSRIPADQIDGWMASARNGSELGEASIRVFGLNDHQHQDLYLGHIRSQVVPQVEALRKAIERSDRRRVRDEVLRAQRQLLAGSVPYVGLAYDALNYLVPNAQLLRFRASWPQPGEVALLPTASPNQLVDSSGTGPFGHSKGSQPAVRRSGKL